MKNIIVIISLLVTSIFISKAQEGCNILKLKTIKTDYLGYDGSSFYKIGYLDSATINIDTLSIFYPGINVVNISNDTFFANDKYTIEDKCCFYSDTGCFGCLMMTIQYYFGENVFPNDTMRVAVNLRYNLLDIINGIKETDDIDFEQISYWKLIIGIGSTSKDGYYSDSAFYAGTDTSIFYVVRGNNSIAPITKNYELGVYPNPTTNQLRITNYELRDGTEDYTIYNVVGQKVMQGVLQGRDAINCVSTINVEPLAKGMYYLRIAEKTVKFIKE